MDKATLIKAKCLYDKIYKIEDDLEMIDKGRGIGINCYLQCRFKLDEAFSRYTEYIRSDLKKILLKQLSELKAELSKL